MSHTCRLRVASEGWAESSFRLKDKSPEALPLILDQTSKLFRQFQALPPESEHLSNRWDTTLKFRCFTVVLAQWHCEGASRWMLLIAATLSVQALWAEWPQQVICQGRSAVTLLQVISQLETHQVALRLSQKFTAKFLTSALSALFVLRLEQELCEVHKHVHSVLETVLTVCCTSHWRRNFS